MNILFVCSRNQWRSPTAESIFKSYKEFNFRSAGTSESARVKVSEKLISWADLIFVMEKKHKEKLSQRFTSLMLDKEVIVLDIPDDYRYMGF